MKLLLKFLKLFLKFIRHLKRCAKVLVIIFLWWRCSNCEGTRVQMLCLCSCIGWIIFLWWRKVSLKYVNALLNYILNIFEELWIHHAWTVIKILSCIPGSCLNEMFQLSTLNYFLGRKDWALFFYLYSYVGFTANSTQNGTWDPIVWLQQ